MTREIEAREDRRRRRRKGEEEEKEKQEEIGMRRNRISKARRQKEALHTYRRTENKNTTVLLLTKSKES